MKSCCSKAAFDNIILMITTCVRPTAIDGYIRVLFELVVGIITVALDSAFIGTKYLPGDFAATASAVIVEHDRATYRIANAPFMRLTQKVSFFVYKDSI